MTVIDRRTATYLHLAITKIESHQGMVPLTDTCPECSLKIHTWIKASDADGHLVYRTTSDTYAVLVGCEGYWVIDPALIGMDRKGWTAMNISGYPMCPGAWTARNLHWLCFMERRDLDECPECGTEIPEELRLNADMTGPRV